MAVSEEAIIRAYTHFLGRKPESHEAIQCHMEAKDETALAEIMLDCAEFRITQRRQFVLQMDSRTPCAFSLPNQTSPAIRIALIGNCQIYSLAECIKAMADTYIATTTLEFSHEMWASATDGTLDLSSMISRHDIVLLHPDAKVIPLIEEKYSQALSKFRYIPRIIFQAFHPDNVYINVRGKRGFFQGPLGDYNSSLIFYAWMRGMSISQTLELFTDEVYQKLGFHDYWKSSKDALLSEGVIAGLPLDEMLNVWTGRGCFMYSINHPRLFVMADIARSILENLGVGTIEGGELYVNDLMADHAAWPVYPEIARRLGFKGNYFFKMPPRSCPPGKPIQFLNLEEFVRTSFEALSKARKEDLVCDRIMSEQYRDMESTAGEHPSFVKGSRDSQASSFRRTPESRQFPADGGRNALAPGFRRGDEGTVALPDSKPVIPESNAHGRMPYEGLPPYHFWSKAISGSALSEVDPVVSFDLKVDRQMKIATAGSCFAQHISRALRRNGFNFYIAEEPPALFNDDPVRFNYGVFSARYGNIYTARQLVQLFDRAYGAFVPVDKAWQRPDGRYADPFRPRIEPHGFATPRAVETSRAEHLCAVRTLFESLDVLVFTLGLTEAWRAKGDGAVFPLAPGVAAGKLDFDRCEYVNFGVAEVSSDLEDFVERLLRINPTARIIFTVSPVPLVATYESQHVLVSTTYSKSVLRVAAAGVVGRHSNCCAYFPSYEVIAGNYNRGVYYEEDMRSVNAAGVDHVMRLFLSHCAAGQDNTLLDSTLLGEAEGVKDVICDEEELDALHLGSGASKLFSAQ